MLPRNSFLKKIGIKQDPNCSCCCTTDENLAHLFWHCPNVQTFWGTLTEKLADFHFIPGDYSMEIAVFFRPKVGYLQIFSSDKLLLSFSQTLHLGLWNLQQDPSAKNVFVCLSQLTAIFLFITYFLLFT